MDLKEVIARCVNDECARITFAYRSNDDVQITYVKPDEGITIYNGWKGSTIVEIDEDVNIEELAIAIDCYKDIKKAFGG